MKNLLKPLANTFLVPLRLKVVVSATDASIQVKRNAWETTYKICVEEMNDIMQIVKYIEDSSLLTTGVCETIKNESNKQKLDFLAFFLGTLGASLIGKMLTGKRVVRVDDGFIWAGEETKRADWDF